ncbi:MAG: dihydroorotase [Bacteroidales bacterium]|nr:dihydroorotase [Bacteroidales bacterium]MCB9012971.1 dihydroorotase [Bacteroidales bacterium]
MSKILIKNVSITNEGRTFTGNVLIDGEFISRVSENEIPVDRDTCIINGEGKLLLPGVIDDQVHFREPGFTHKGDIYTESRAAIAGGVTSYMEMPNTHPQTISIKALNEKYELAAGKSAANYAFYFGATNDNISEIHKVDPVHTPGVKVFMGASTGNMLVDKRESLEKIFAESPVLIATHCEDETTIRNNIAMCKHKYGEDIPMSCHPLLRSEEACYISSSFAVELANRYNSKLHVLHISTARELSLFEKGPVNSKKITAEGCIHHLWFNDTYYESRDTLIKWNPAIKTEKDRLGLIDAVIDDRIDVIATDHAPHTLIEKSNRYFQAPSGGPMVQHSLLAMLEFVKRGVFTIERVVHKMCHAPAELFSIDRRGYIREGYYADLVLVDPNKSFEITISNLLYKCHWSPLEGEIMHHKIDTTFVNGKIVYQFGEVVENGIHSMALKFNR